MSMADTNISFEEAVKIGIREGIKYIKEQEYNRSIKKYDKRLRNTRLLLKHYRSLKAHNSIAEDTTVKIYKENAIDVLDDIEPIDDEKQYVQALSRTKIRTLIIVGHLNKAMKYYKSICETEDKLKERRYKIISYMYLENREDDITPTYEEVAEHFNLNVKTVGRDVRLAIEDLSVLFFGIDGIKL
jgi:tetratricopeptide (TPR) repeat protein